MIHTHNRVRGFYKLEIFKAVETPTGLKEIPGSRQRCAEFENLITDIGLNRLGIDSISEVMSYCYVGSGSATPQTSDSGMNQIVGVTGDGQSQSGGVQTTQQPYFAYFSNTLRFSPGDAAGNLSEVGVGWSGNSNPYVFSRALIQDADGNPASLTVRSDEYLDVTYELRVYPDFSDTGGQITLDGESYNYTARPAGFSTINNGGWALGRANSYAQAPFAKTGQLGDVTGFPDGITGAGVAQPLVYADSSLQASVQNSWGLSNGNIGGIRSLVTYIGWTCWQVQFDRVSDGAAIPKDSNKVLTLTFTHSWARG
ncbi:hypothetical protein [Microbulbifer sp. TRSA005]|uniref:hypothetical protein n=1 Tax=unclassified Microbulbifer TaxID=2619833 RepID=UPI0040398769